MESNHRFVYGLGGGLVYSTGQGGKWQENLPKILATFDNAVLVSPVDMPKKAAILIYNSVGTDRFYLDSGGFTLFKDQKKLGADSPEFHAKCEKMKNKFLGILREVRPVEVFELDNEYFRHDPDMLSPKNYCRQEIYDIIGKYPTPVFKMHQGFEYWKKLCECDLYPRLAIGGLAQTREWNKHPEEFRKMMAYARHCGKKVHLLGCYNVDAFKTIRPDTADWSIFEFKQNIKRARREHPELKTHAELSIHAALYAFARAKSKSFLYDSLMDSGEYC